MIPALHYKQTVLPGRLYTKNEEIANGITHGLGVLLSLVGLLYLEIPAIHHGSKSYVVSLGIYGSSLVILYLASTLYHSIQKTNIKRIFQIIDHGAIFMLIAGTHTPFLVILYPKARGLTLLTLIWMIALLGIGYKAIYIQRFEKLSALGYIFMSGVFLLGGTKILTSFPPKTLTWISFGGFCYLTGLIFAAWHRPYFHTIWHVFVLAGSICHFIAVLYLLPWTSPLI
jgi:hemolysin III